MAQRGSWELPRRPGEHLGVLLGSLGKPFGAPRELWERKRRKSENHRFAYGIHRVFEVPVAPKASQNRPGVASRGLVERAEVASSVFGRVASRKVAPKRRKPAGLSGTQWNPAAT